jgi:Protein of unknown function (DUF3761)
MNKLSAVALVVTALLTSAAPTGAAICRLPPPAPPGATAKCNDGSYSRSHHRPGTCSSRGGVATWLDCFWNNRNSRP